VRLDTKYSKEKIAKIHHYPLQHLDGVRTLPQLVAFYDIDTLTKAGKWAMNKR